MGRWGTQKYFDASLLLLIGADLAFILIPTYTPFWVFCLIAVFNGIGFGSIATASQVRAQMVVDKSQVGVATSFNTLMKYLGQTVMMVFYGMTFNVVVASGLKKQPSLTSEMMNKIVSPVQAKSLDPARFGPSAGDPAFIHAGDLHRFSDCLAFVLGLQPYLPAKEGLVKI